MSDLKLREAFDSNSVPLKNITLRKAHDRIEQLEAALREIYAMEELSIEDYDGLFWAHQRVARKALEKKND